MAEIQDQQEWEAIAALEAETRLLLARHNNRMAKQLMAGPATDWQTILLALAAGAGLYATLQHIFP